MSNVRIDEGHLTEAWEDDAAGIAAAVRAFTRRRALRSGCRIVLFELAEDPDLHVNVIHPRPTALPAGWSGPGATAGGFVHNRRFRFSESHRIARLIQEMVYAPPEDAARLGASPRTRNRDPARL